MKTPIMFILLLALASCKKEIQVKLDSKESKLVIEAEMAANKSENLVRLTKTTAVSQTGEPEAASGAVVVISDRQGYQETLKEDQPGSYHTSSFAGLSGRTYYLSVRYENKTYTSESTLQAPVKLDTVLVIRGSYAGTPMDGFMPLYQDEAGTKNYYRFIQYLNGKRLPGSILRDDEFTDGQYSNEPIFRMDLHLKAGDRYEVEMQCVDQAVHKYFKSKAQTANLDNAAPANPVSNISNGALGFFNVYFPQKRAMLVQD